MATTFTGYDGIEYGIGDRVELHPATDLWMRGARFGKVIGASLTPKDWEYMGTCVPDDDRIIVHTFRHRCATSSKNGARFFDRTHSMHADRSIYVNIPASAGYMREVRA